MDLETILIIVYSVGRCYYFQTARSYISFLFSDLLYFLIAIKFEPGDLNATLLAARKSTPHKVYHMPLYLKSAALLTKKIIWLGSMT